MGKSKKDMLIMLVFMVLSMVVYFVFIPSQIKASANSGFNNRTFPQFTMAAIFLASAAGFVEAFIRSRKEEKTESKGFDFSELLPLIGFVLILGYALLFHFVSKQWRGYGFILATIIFIPVFLGFLKCKNWRYYVASYGFATGMYLVFRFLLKVTLR